MHDVAEVTQGLTLSPGHLCIIMRQLWVARRKKYWQKFYYLQVVDIVSCLSRTKFIFHKCFHISSIPFRLSHRLYTSETFHKSQKLSMEYLNNTHTAVSPLSANNIPKHFCIPLNVFAFAYFVIKIKPETQ